MEKNELIACQTKNVSDVNFANDSTSFSLQQRNDLFPKQTNKVKRSNDRWGWVLVVGWED